MREIHYYPIAKQGDVQIDRATCTNCLLCSRICSGKTLVVVDHHVEFDPGSGLGCIGCGQCMAACPTGSITVTGRNIQPADRLDRPHDSSRMEYTSLRNLMLNRRSIRAFQDRPVEDELIEKILDAASMAPMGVPPSNVGVLVLPTREAVQDFRDTLLPPMIQLGEMLSSPVKLLMRPFISGTAYDIMAGFLPKATRVFDEMNRQGVDLFMYDPPAAIYFYGGEGSDDADAIIAGTYAMLAGEALGLGTCMLGFPGNILQRDTSARKKFNLPDKIKPGIVVIFGYPRYKFSHAIKRRFGKVDYVHKSCGEFLVDQSGHRNGKERVGDPDFSPA